MENILGNILPVELQRKISLYMEHPTAEIIKNHRNNMYVKVIEHYMFLETRDKWDDYDDDEVIEITYDDLVKWNGWENNFLEDIEYHNLICRDLLYASR